MKLTLYHGSERLIIPEFGKGKPGNDYGLGFYCTENPELAKEWACAHGKDGYANAYELETEGLTVLDLNSDKYDILNWLAILLDNRKFPLSGSVAPVARDYILSNFLPRRRNTLPNI